MTPVRPSVGIVAVVLWMGVTACGGKKDKAGAAAKTEPAPAVPGPAEAGPEHEDPEHRVGSSQFHIELAQVYDRYQDRDTAADHFARAIHAASRPEQKVRAYLGLARIERARGDTTAAIKGLETALGVAKTENSEAGGMPRGDIVAQLGDLYVETKQFDKAEAILARSVADARDPWHRRELISRLVRARIAAGTLEDHIATAEASIAKAKQPDEQTLWFLAMAYDGAGRGMEMPPEAPAADAPSQPQDHPAKLVTVFERLRALHPEDRDLHGQLVRAYERAGRIDDAVTLLRTPPARRTDDPAEPGPPDPRESCDLGMHAEGGRSPQLATAEQVVRLYLRSDARDKAAAEVAALVALSKDDAIGVAAYLVGARLYTELGDPKAAQQTLAKADKIAGSVEQRRRVAMLRADLLSRQGDRVEATKLYESWKKSDDDCLRAEATRRLAVRTPGHAPAEPPAEP